MGMGDVKIFRPIGLFIGWKLALLALLMSIMAGGLISIFLLLFRIKDRKSAIPLALTSLRHLHRCFLREQFINLVFVIIL
jgi:Flp pilus assembly protein protease CpaA